MKNLVLLIVLFFFNQSFGQSYLFVEIESKADYQRVPNYFYIKLEDTISLCSIVSLNSNLISILNNFEKREYIFFQKASIVLREDSARVELAELEFYKDKNNYNSIFFDKINYKISLSLVNSGIKIESKAVKTSYKNFVPEFFVQDGELVYNSITVYKTNVITGLTVP